MKHIILSLVIISSLNAKAAPSFSQNISPEIQQQITQDIEAVKAINGGTSSALYKEIFANRNLNGSDLLAFFNKRISNFDKNDCGGGPAVAACVIAWISPDTMWITPSYEKFSMPQIFRISVLFHESRHTEDDHQNWSHARCPVPFLDDNGKDIVGIFSGAKMEGALACDETPLGAYGMQAVLLKNVEKYCTSCNEKTTMDAQLFGDDTINRMSSLPARQQLKNDR